MAGAGTGPLVPNWPHNSTGVQPVTGDMVPFVESCVCDGTATHDPARSCDWLQLETGRLAGIAVDVGQAYRSSGKSVIGADALCLCDRCHFLAEYAKAATA